MYAEEEAIYIIKTNPASRNAAFTRGLEYLRIFKDNFCRRKHELPPTIAFAVSNNNEARGVFDSIVMLHIAKNKERRND